MRSLLIAVLLFIPFNPIIAQNEWGNILPFAGEPSVSVKTQEYPFKRESLMKPIGPEKSVSKQLQRKFGQRFTLPYQKEYRNFVVAGILPFFNAGNAKFHVGYARAISRHWVLGADYSYFDLKRTTKSSSIWITKTTERRRNGSEFAVSGRYYFSKNKFISNNFNGFYIRSGVSYTSFLGTKYIEEYFYFPSHVFDPDIPDTGPVRTETWRSANVRWYSMFAAPGYTFKRDRFLIDLNAGYRAARTSYHQNQNNYRYEGIPIFANLSLGFTF